ncbi:Na/Pi cotransporter family protein [Pseudoroseomonas cervicalis]|uniref:Na/Pi cotransporter family protein n=1 Tax=Teichococcus cervicalis TaxID=204525 RepID=UPI0022F1D57E|nr:Na/Pi cotransporter family protein [Pseudoroseomonas cervicalis]WBV44797.1 Na/Pi cotransporter family protein [Pseudoroseomonas cervicalis]
MAVILTLLDLAGTVALLLWGVRMVQTGLQRAFGPQLRGFLARALGDRPRAFLAGLGVTTLLQSSTATGLMVTGFAAGGSVALVPALAVMLGANIGTTLIVQLLSFDVARLAPLLVLLGFLLFRRSTASRRRDLGRVAIGLGLMLMALHQMLGLLAPIGSQPGLRGALAALQGEPLVTLLIGAALSWAAHSSVAVVLLVMSLATHGVVALPVALALVLGANLGTALNPVLEGAGAADPAARRVPMGNLLIRAAGCLAALPALPWLAQGLAALQPDPARALADAHTGFNLLLGLVFLPLLPAYARLLRRLLPARLEQEDPSRPRHLDRAALENPAIAIGLAAREALRLADVLQEMLQGMRDAFARDDRGVIPETRRMDDVLDRLNAAIKDYLTALDGAALDAADRRRAERILLFATHLEQAGDVVDRNLMAEAAKRLKRGLAPPPAQRAALLALVDRLQSNLGQAASLLLTEDLRAARLLAGEKARFRDIERRAVQAHFAGLHQPAGSAPADPGALPLDLIRDLKRVNAHLVEAAAYPVLREGGELLPTRLASPLDGEE